MSIFAVLQASIASGSPSTGHIIAALGQSCQFSRTAADGVRTCRYELIGYPAGFACPSGWTTVGTQYHYTGESPSSFTLSHSGKYLPRLRLNGVGDDDTTGQLDTTVGIEIYYPNGSRGVVTGELDQFGGVAAALNANAAIVVPRNTRIPGTLALNANKTFAVAGTADVVGKTHVVVTATAGANIQLLNTGATVGDMVSFRVLYDVLDWAVVFKNAASTTLKTIVSSDAILRADFFFDGAAWIYWG
jgi:hypothetical protein